VKYLEMASSKLVKKNKKTWCWKKLVNYPFFNLRK